MESVQTDTENSNMATEIAKENLVPVSSGQKEGGNEVKPFYFETETKRLKEYYLTCNEKLVGRKILFNNSSGIVRYFGQLQHQGLPANSKDELWIGIEWD